MRQIQPNTSEYKDCLACMLSNGFYEPLKRVRRHENEPIQVINEGDEVELPKHPLNFVRYECDNGFILFPI